MAAAETAPPRDPADAQHRGAPFNRGPVRLLAIDALRGAAALAVFLFHVSVIADFDKRVLPPFTLFGRTFTGLLSPLSLGSSGVHLFFVISGFCLALQQLRGGRLTLPASALPRYARSRLARIGPAYWLTVLLAAALCLLRGQRPPLGLPVDTALHLFFLHGFDPRAFLSLHGGLWSMATEVQFYVLFPLFLWLFARLRPARFVILFAAATLACRLALALAIPQSPWAPVLAYQLPGRAFEFALGIALADLYYHPRPVARRACLFALGPLFFIALSIRAFGPSSLPDLALGAFYFVLCGAILLAPPRTGPGPRLLRVAAAFGRASYSFFLIHFLILIVLSIVPPAPSLPPWPRFFYLCAAGLPLSSLAAVALYLGVELPAWRRLRG